MNADPKIWLNANASHISTDGETSPDTARYTLTIEEASELFSQAGVPRAPRTITRFCALGDLECIRVETEKNFKYLIDHKSVEKRIEQLKQALHFTSKTSPDMSRHIEIINETQPDMSRHDEQARETPARNEEVEFFLQRVEELENDNIHLKISQKANEQVINQMNAERKEFIAQVREMTFQLGEATAKLQQLAAPRQETPTNPILRADETMPREAEVVSNTPPPAPLTAPQSAPAPEPQAEKPGFLKRLFGR